MQVIFQHASYSDHIQPKATGHVPEQLVLSNPTNYVPNEKQQEDINLISFSTEDEPSQPTVDCATSVPDQVELSEEELNSMGGRLKITCGEVLLFPCSALYEKFVLC